MANVLLCVTGGIAAYKSVHLLRLLQKSGHDVRVVLTANATRFISPLTFQALSTHPVHTDEFSAGAPALNHIESAEWADIVIIAPASANTIAKLASGIADNLMTSILLAFTGDLFVFPAMNVHMYNHPATQTNISTLKQRGVYVGDPSTGALACGYNAPGRLPEPEEIVAAVSAHLKGKALLSGVRVLITAGPTVEDIDPVRYITNRSSGRMGYALANAARQMGADVTLISGPTSLTPPPVSIINVRSASDMLNAVEAHVNNAGILIMAAAVADYTAQSPAPQKIKKNDAELRLTFVKTKDILKTISHLKKPAQVFAGFAAESENHIDNALQKLKSKQLDMIALNDISRTDIGFDVPDNEITLLFADGMREEISKRSKSEAADIILARLSEIYLRKNNDK